MPHRKDRDALIGKRSLGAPDIPGGVELARVVLGALETAVLDEIGAHVLDEAARYAGKQP
jgi:hypothetical protein